MGPHVGATYQISSGAARGMAEYTSIHVKKKVHAAASGSSFELATNSRAEDTSSCKNKAHAVVSRSCFELDSPPAALAPLIGARKRSLGAGDRVMVYKKVCAGGTGGQCDKPATRGAVRYVPEDVGPRGRAGVRGRRDLTVCTDEQCSCSDKLHVR